MVKQLREVGGSSQGPAIGVANGTERRPVPSAALGVLLATCLVACRTSGSSAPAQPTTPETERTPRYSIALSKILELAPTSNAATYLERTFDLAYDAGSVDGSRAGTALVVGSIETACVATVTQLMKAGDPTEDPDDLAKEALSCSSASSDKYKGATIPGHAYATSRLLVTSKVSHEVPDAMPSFMAAFEAGYSAGVDDAWPRDATIADAIRQVCMATLKRHRYAPASAESLCLQVNLDCRPAGAARTRE